VETLLGKGKLVAFRPDAAEDCSTELKFLFQEAKQENPELGASIRWCLQARENGKPKLVLQSLPAGAGKLRCDPRLTADETAAIHLETIDLVADLIPGNPSEGFVPVIFARNPETVKKELADHPDRLQIGIRIQKSFRVCFPYKQEYFQGNVLVWFEE
jgi:hypothetical protein